MKQNVLLVKQTFLFQFTLTSYNSDFEEDAPFTY